MSYMSLFATEHWNWDTWTGEEDQEGYGEEEYDGEAYDESGAHCEDEGFIVSQLHSPLHKASCLLEIILVKIN